ncbi:MAG TPA: pyridoxal phosphate-dependent aminotransferase [Thermoanaerobaculia bacterium]
MRPVVSRRGQAMPASPIRKLTPFADQARRRGIHVYHLNIGQPDLETPPAMRDRLSRIQEKVFAYTPSGGTPEYLASLVTYYARLGISVSAEQLVATAGGSEAIQFAMFAGTNEGDEALVVEPYYTNYNAFATLAGVRLVPLTSSGEDGFHLPPRAQWDRALTDRTRLVLLCNPNNPTGTVYRPDELEMVTSFCRDHGLFLVADEVYREFVYDGRRSVSALQLPGFEQQVIVVDSLSKRYSACGIRLGCLVTRNPDVHQAALRMAQGRLSPPGLAQLAAVGAQDLGPGYFASIVAEYEKRRDLLYEGLRKIPGVFLTKPEGAFYFVARLPIADSEDFARWLLADYSDEQATVMVAPARGFYATPGLGANEVRIAYVLKEDDLRASIRILKRALEAYSSDRDAQPAAALSEGPEVSALPEV